MPAGLDTELISGTAALSSGEAQLLACARIFLKDPGLLILDEPTSRMDPVTEQLVRRALDRLMKNRTTLVIAHRLSTIEKLDSILILEDGKVSEIGAQSDLRENPDSRFNTLLRMGLELDT
jgi:ABC-type multidrug transport system fused ATPase/permease subunit